MLLLRYLSRRTWYLLLSRSKACGAFEVSFAIYGSEVGSLEKGVLVINVARRG